MASNRAIRARRSLVLREVDGFMQVGEQLRNKTRDQAAEIEDARALHPYIDRLEAFLVQVKTLTQHRSKW